MHRLYKGRQEEYRKIWKSLIPMQKIKVTSGTPIALAKV